MDVFSEKNQLSDEEKERMQDIKKQLDLIWQQEETKAWQRSRDRHILEGDRNTSYFHALANQRRRKKKIDTLNGPSGPVSDTKGMLNIAVNFYKNLFGREDRPNISLDDNFWGEQDLLTIEESAAIEKPFSEEEIRTSIFGSYACGAPGPDGFSFLFYQKFGSHIKSDFMALVRDFEAGTLDVSKLNYYIITLIPK